MKNYEELSGGVGKNISHRAQRRLVRNLLSERAASIRVGEQQFTPYDLALNGVSFDAPPEQVPWPVDTVVFIDLQVHATTVYSGPARIARIEERYGERRVGMQLLSGFLDVHEMQRLDEENNLSRDLEEGPERVMATVAPAYLEILGRAVHFLAFYRRVLGYHEARLGGGPEGRARLAERALERIRPRWHALRLEAAEVTQDLPPSELKAAKSVTELLLTPFLMDAPVLEHAYRKPLGYPGDFTVMTHIYANRLEGESTFGQVFHKLACEEPLSAGVRSRKNLIRRLLGEEHRRLSDAGLPMRTLSLGCGPAREVVEYLLEGATGSTPVHWTLIDQEERALNVAYHDVLRAIGPNSPSTVQGLYLSFEQLMQDASVVRGGTVDFLYCVGLFDYLKPSQAKALAAALYERVGSGGLVAIGNAFGPNQHTWLAELVLDWSLIYRTPDELKQVGAPLRERGAEVTVLTGQTEAYDFLLLRKP